MLTEELRRELIRRATEVRVNAYVPYSHYQVGAALLADSGKIYTGANVENAAFPVTMCAERAALYTAVSAGDRRFVAIAVVTENAGTPCGSCRQALAEFGLGIIVLIADDQGNVKQETTVKDLLPGAFGPADLV
jgi:cytidine deaminase